MCAFIRRGVSYFSLLAVSVLSCAALAAEPATERVHKEDLVTIGERVSVRMDEAVEGDVVCIGADIEIAGTVKGDAVCVCGNIVLDRTAVVEGDVVAVGGRIDKHQEAKIHGESVSIRIRLNIDGGGSDAHSSI